MGAGAEIYSLIGKRVHMLLKKAEDSYEKNYTAI